MQVGLNTRSFVSEQASEYVFTAQRSGLLNACARSFCCVAEVETKQNNDIESKARLLDGQDFKSALLVQRATSFVDGQRTCFLQMLTTNLKECKFIEICICSHILINQPFLSHHHQLKNMHLWCIHGWVGCADEYNLWQRRVICSDPICKPVKNAFNQPMRNAQYMQSARNPVGMKTQPIHGRNAISSWVTSNQDPTR